MGLSSYSIKSPYAFWTIDPIRLPVLQLRQLLIRGLAYDDTTPVYE